MLLPGDLELRDWMPSFLSKGVSEEEVRALQGTFSQHMNQELRTFEQIFQHVCMAQIAIESQPKIDPIWVAQHAAFTPKVFIGNVPDPQADTGQQANAAAAGTVQTDDNAQEQQAHPLPRAERQDIAEHARVAWKEAIEQRRKAFRDWDEYVRVKHEEFIRLRTEAKLK